MILTALILSVPGCTLTLQPSATSPEQTQIEAIPTATPFGETPDQVGSGDVLFDIYQKTALVDLDMDGADEEVAFKAGDAASELHINGETYPVDIKGLAQLFAITDVDDSDGMLELVFTDKYRELSGTDKVSSYLYWWDGTQLIKMGALTDVKFDGSFISAFDPAEVFDAKGTVMYPVQTREFADVWYMGHFICDGAARILKEDAYTVKPLNAQSPLTLKEYCVLLKKIDSTYFGMDYAVIWDYASGYSTLGRDYSDDIVSFIPQAGEDLTIIRVYGAYWYKLQATDGKTGWLKCKDGKVQGYYQVMHYAASDIFDGI